MEWLVRASWLILAAIHAAPAMVLFAPNLTEKLYGLSPEGTAGLLVIHRAAMFLAVLIVALFAVVSPGARRAATLVVGISVVSFLIIYLRLGLPEGPLRTVAIVDAVALVPLILVTINAWRE